MPLNESAWPEDTPLSQTGQTLFTCVDQIIQTGPKFRKSGRVDYSLKPMRTHCQFTVKRPERRVGLTVVAEQQPCGVQVVEWVGLVASSFQRFQLEPPTPLLPLCLRRRSLVSFSSFGSGPLTTLVQSSGVLPFWSFAFKSNANTGCKHARLIKTKRDLTRLN